METQSEVEKQIKAGVYKTKGKQEKSDIWNNFKIVVDKGAGICELSEEWQGARVQWAQVWYLRAETTHLRHDPWSEYADTQR